MNTENRPVPQYKSVKFEGKTHAESLNKLYAWLAETAGCKLTFKDHGQDMLEMYVAPTGEILHCNANSDIYDGAFVDTKKLELNQPIYVMVEWESEYEPLRAFIIESITTFEVCS